MFHRQSFHSTPEDTGPAHTQMQLQHRSRAPGPPYNSRTSQPPGRAALFTGKVFISTPSFHTPFHKRKWLHTGRKHRDFVVVVKGPLLRFTREVLKFYTSRGLHTVYSGRRDGCLSSSDLAFIEPRFGQP